MLRYCCLLICFIFLFNGAHAQTNISDTSISTIMLGGFYMGQVPAGDMKARFGLSNTIGGQVAYKSHTNWLLSLEYSFLFSNHVREQGALDSVARSYGYLLNGDGQFQQLQYFERGTIIMFKAAKILPFFKVNPNSGFIAKLALGYMEHKIKYFYVGNAPPQLQGNYIKGYDRLSSGMCTSASLGYLFMSNHNYLNFMIEAEIIDGFTYSRRSWDFDLMRQDTKLRQDILYGLKATLFIPLYGKGGQSGAYYY